MTVIVSLKKSTPHIIPQITVIALFANATVSGKCLIICCQTKAYIPSNKMIPEYKQQNSKLKNWTFDTILLKIPVIE